MVGRKILLVLAVTAGVAAPGSAEAACAMAPPVISLGDFTVAEGPRPFYLGIEGSSASLTVYLSGGCGQDMGVTWSTSDGTATAGLDYSPSGGPISAFVQADDTEAVHPQVPVTADGANDPVVESAVISLSNPQNGSISPPPSVPLLIVDGDGGPRVALEGVPSSQSETFPVARIAVFRSGDVSSGAAVNYVVAPGPTNPATPGADYSVTSPPTLTFGAGDRFETIDLSIVNDKLGEAPEDLTITLSGGEVVQPNTTTFTIEDNEESVFPTSRFHHPRDKWRYKKSDYRIREFHVFATDNEGGAGVVAAEIALRRNLRNGKCAWLTTSGWQKKDCQNKEWLPTKYDEVGDLFFFRMKQLKSSAGTRIKDYTAFSRAIDGAENVEKDFVKKRNANTFEIKRTRKRRG